MILNVLIGLGLAADPFLNFAKEFGKNYANTKEFTMRREIFMKNYQDMIEHNARYEAREVSWSRKVTEFYDLTQEEFIIARGLGKIILYLEL